MNGDKISKLIKDIRNKNNLSQKEFADKFNVSSQAVSKWELGKNIPDISIIKDICREYNLSIDEFLDTGYKKNNKVLIIPLIIVLFIIVGLFIIINNNNNNNFEFKRLEANCSDFKVTGSMAYNKDKTSIYISNIDYCGEEDNTKYDNISCNLYEDNGNLKYVIEKCNSKENITIDDFLKDLSFTIDDYKQICKQYKDNNIYLEIDTYKNNKNNSYKIPLKLMDNCGERVVLD